MKAMGTQASELDCPSSKGNHAPHPEFKKHKIQIFFEIGPELVRPAHLKAQWRFESNQNKSKQMKINDVSDYFTSKVYSAAILIKNFHLYQL